MRADVNLADWQSVEKLLSTWYHEASVNRAANANKALLNRKLNYWLGVPVVIFSSIVGSAAFSQIHSPSGSNPVRITAGVLSIVSAVLAGLQTFFGFGERAEKYRAVGAGYEQVAIEIQKIQAFPVHLRGEVVERINALEDRLTALAQGSPDPASFETQQLQP
jgi:hypothetical protein